MIIIYLILNLKYILLFKNVRLIINSSRKGWWSSKSNRIPKKSFQKCWISRKIFRTRQTMEGSSSKMWHSRYEFKFNKQRNKEKEKRIQRSRSLHGINRKKKRIRKRKSRTHQKSRRTLYSTKKNIFPSRKHSSSFSSNFQRRKR